MVVLAMRGGRRDAMAELLKTAACMIGHHDWAVGSFVIDTNPPIEHRHCRRCGKKDHTVNGEWSGEPCFCQVEPTAERPAEQPRP